MKIQAEDAETGETYEAEVNHLDENFMGFVDSFRYSDADIARLIDNLNISADAKSLLYALTKQTIRAGQFVIKIGRKIIDLICLLCKEFPNAGFGLIFGAIAGFLVSTIPLLGVAIGSLVTPVLMILGMAAGLKEDIKDKALTRRIAEVNAQFDPLKA